MELPKSGTQIKTDRILVKENIIRFENVTLNLNNVAQVNTGKVKIQIPIIPLIITAVIGLILLKFTAMFGIIVLLAIAGYSYYLYNASQNSDHYLTFILNSGTIYRISVKDVDFLNTIQDYIEKSFNHDVNGSYTINIDKKVINGTNIDNGNGAIIGQQNVADHQSTVNASAVNNTTINWSKVSNEIQQNLKSFPENSDEHQALENLLSASQLSDETKVQQVLHRFKNIFTSDFCKDIFSNTVAGWILHLLNIG
ncbi:hypothetical protein ACFQH1_04115 [Lactiplantibacillus daoliensis]|uniref:Uncharacterized protein n=1 Tax=Lactiplantibacillus daoliensis TaxID=2559916 RepID=A0ABW1UE37_9LACO|nr:hypothetical protein [Lactiplantibacillus daoliensis]